MSKYRPLTRGRLTYFLTSWDKSFCTRLRCCGVIPVILQIAGVLAALIRARNIVIYVPGASLSCRLEATRNPLSIDGERFTYHSKLSDDYIIWTDATQPSTRWSGTGNVGYDFVFSIENGTTLKITELHAGIDNVTHRFPLTDLR